VKERIRPGERIVIRFPGEAEPPIPERRMLLDAGGAAELGARRSRRRARGAPPPPPQPGGFERVYFGDIEVLGGDIYAGITARAHLVQLDETSSGIWAETGRWTREWTSRYAGAPSVDVRVGYDGPPTPENRRIYVSAWDRIWRVSNINGNGFSEWLLPNLTATVLGPAGSGITFAAYGAGGGSQPLTVYRATFGANSTLVALGSEIFYSPNTRTYRLPHPASSQRTGNHVGFLSVARSMPLVVGGQLYHIAQHSTLDDGASSREYWCGYHDLLSGSGITLSGALVAYEQNIQAGDTLLWMRPFPVAITYEASGPLWEVIANPYAQAPAARLARRASHVSDNPDAQRTDNTLVGAYRMAVSARYLYIAAGHGAQGDGVVLARRYTRDTLEFVDEVVYSGPRYASDSTTGEWFLSGLEALSL
jgi:hypothetical protein